MYYYPCSILLLLLFLFYDFIDLRKSENTCVSFVLCNSRYKRTTRTSVVVSNAPEVLIYLPSFHRNVFYFLLFLLPFICFPIFYYLSLLCVLCYTRLPFPFWRPKSLRFSHLHNIFSLLGVDVYVCIYVYIDEVTGGNDENLVWGDPFLTKNNNPFWNSRT